MLEEDIDRKCKILDIRQRIPEGRAIVPFEITEEKSGLMSRYETRINHF